MNNYHIPSSVRKRWKKELTEKGILFLYGMVGSGKTSQAIHFAEKVYKEFRYLSAKEENFTEEVNNIMQNHKKGKEIYLLILDDLHLLKDKDEQKKLFEILISQNHISSFLPIMLLSQGVFPSYLSPLRMTNLLSVISASCLKLSDEFIETEMMSQSFGVLPDEMDRSIEPCIQLCRGNPIVFRTFMQHWSDSPSQPEQAAKKTTQDFLQYFDHFVVSSWEGDIHDTAIRLAAFPQITDDAILHIFDENAVDLVQKLNETYYFIKKEDHYVIEPILLEFLRKKLSLTGKMFQNKLYCKLGDYYHESRELEPALIVYHKAENWEKLVEILVFFCENGGGCYFARIADQYIWDIPEEYEEGNPALLGAKIMLFSYKMQREEFTIHLEKLRFLAYNETNPRIQKEAQYFYMRTIIASPFVDGRGLMANLKEINRYTFKNKEVLRNILPTGNYPSFVSGGLDLTDLIPASKMAYPFMKHMMDSRLGVEGYGVGDGSMGEMYYEQNKKTKAMSYLTRALSDANLKGSLRVNYAVTAIMAKLLVSDGQADHARTTLENILTKVDAQRFYELSTNISASLLHFDLLKQNRKALDLWMDKSAPDEHKPFYITDKFILFTKAKVYVNQHRFMEALFILDVLEQYALTFNRTYFLTETKILRSIILYRLGEPWETPLFDGVNLLRNYRLVRVFADYGKPLLPLWQQADWKNIGKKKFIEEVGIELEKMAKFYPQFLPEKKTIVSLTPKEIEILTLVAEGKNNTEISKNISASVSTVKYHLSNINQKLEVDNRVAAVTMARELSLL